jgi:hypothetical protein
MAARLKQSGQRTTATATAALVVAAWFTAPVFAAAAPDLLCNDPMSATLEVAEDDLTATPVSNNEEAMKDHLLKPRVKAAVREVFSEGDEDDIEELDIEAIEEDPAKARIERMSDGEPVPVKRQMYRRDI